MSRKDLTTREPVNCAVDKELNNKQKEYLDKKGLEII